MLRIAIVIIVLLGAVVFFFPSITIAGKRLAKFLKQSLKEK